VTTSTSELEKRVDLLSRAMRLLLFEEKETISKKEARVIEKRLTAYLQTDKSEIEDLEGVPGSKEEGR
jgi:hypothetical protein